MRETEIKPKAKGGRPKKVVPATDIVDKLPEITTKMAEPAPVAKPLNERQRNEEIVKKYTFPDKEGNMVLTAPDKIYEELSLPRDEAIKYLGGKDPELYFKKGWLHSSMKKALGDLLADDRDEVMAMKKKINNPDVLLFKHQKQNQYTLLIPKLLSSYELDAYGEFTDKYVNYDIRVVTFTGANGVPSSFEESYFNKQLDKMLNYLKLAAQKNGLTL